MGLLYLLLLLYSPLDPAVLLLPHLEQEIKQGSVCSPDSL